MKTVYYHSLVLKSRGPILQMTSSETRSICVKQALNTENLCLTTYKNLKEFNRTSYMNSPMQAD